MESHARCRASGSALVRAVFRLPRAKKVLRPVELPLTRVRDLLEVSVSDQFM